MKVTVYSRPGCKYCAATKKLLDDNNINYTDYNIWEEGNERAKDHVIEIMGREAVPLIDIEDNKGKIHHIKGFDEEQLRELLNLKKG